MALPLKVRKIAGAAMLLVFIPFYALVTMAIAAGHLPGTSILTQTVFFAIAGLIWVIPAGAIVSWMLRPPKEVSRPEG